MHSHAASCTRLVWFLGLVREDLYENLYYYLLEGFKQVTDNSCCCKMAALSKLKNQLTSVFTGVNSPKTALLVVATGAVIWKLTRTKSASKSTRR